MADKVGNALDLCDKFLKQAQEQQAKLASETKKADPGSDQMGTSTSHPSGSAPDGTRPAATGSRAAENEADVKKAIGSTGVTGQQDANSVAGKSTAPAVKDHVGASDEGLKGTTPAPAATLPKPPESPSHPSNEPFSIKYSSLIAAGNALVEKLGELAKKSDPDPDPEPDPDPGKMPPQLAAAKAKKEKKEGDKDTVSDPPKAAAERAELAKEADMYVDDLKAGHLTAAALKGEDGAQEKLAEFAGQMVEKYRGEAEAGAKAAEQVVGLTKEQTKAAADMAAQIIKAAEGDADMYGSFLGGMGEGGPDAGAAAGASPAGLGAGPEGPGGGQDAQIEQLAAMLDEMGITPEEVIQAIQSGALSGAGGEGGGAPPGPPAGPPAGPSVPAAPEKEEKGEKEEKEGAASPLAKMAASIVDKVVQLRQAKQAKQGKAAAPAK